jgi:hypothetical protein
VTDFSQTAQTARAAEATAQLLDRAAKRAASQWGDGERLNELAQKYRDYAAGLLAMIPTTTAEPEPAQTSIFDNDAA